MIIDPNDLLPPDYQSYGYSMEKSIDPKILKIYIAIKERFPNVWVNAIGGRRVHNWCGLRSPACAIGAINSYHKKGMAIDLHIPQIQIMLLYDFCTSPEALALGIKRVENIACTPGWVHIDIGEPNPAKWPDKTKPYIFNP